MPDANFPMTWRKAQAANSTSTGFTARVPTSTEPSGNSIIDVRGATDILVMPFGTAAANLTCKIQLWAWQRIKPSTSVGIWIPRPIFEITATLGAATGVVGADLAETDFVADTITVDKGVAVDFDFADDTPAYVIADISGAEKIEFQYTRNGSSASVNALYIAQ